MIDLVVAAVVLGVATAAGLAALRLLGALPAHPTDRLLAGAAVGMGCVGMTGLALAAGGALRPGPLGVAGALALAAGGRELGRTMAGAARHVRLARHWPVLVVGLPVLATALVAVLAPPVGGDQTKYHLVYPRLFAEHGGLVPTPWSFWGYMQTVPNFVYAVAFALRGDVLARALNAASGILAALALGRLAGRHLGRDAAVPVTTLAVSMPITWSLMTRAEVDLPLVGLTALAATALGDWARCGDAGALRRTALLAGLAGGTKIMGLLVPALVGIGVLAVQLRRGGARPVRTLAVFGVVAALAASPCYVRNALETGNPLYPFGYGVFGGEYWSGAASEYLGEYYLQYQLLHAARRGGAPYAGLEVARFPWDVTMHPESFENTARQGLDAGPFALAFGPAVLFCRRRRAAALGIAGFALAYGGIVAAGAWPHPRYVFPATAMLLVAAGAGARALVGRRGLALVTALTVLGHLGAVGRSLREPLWRDQLRVATGRLDATGFLRRNSERYRFWERANAAMGEGGRVLVFEKIPHPYYIASPYTLASYLEQAWIDYRAIASPAALADRARSLGVTHLAVDLAAIDAVGDPFEGQVKRLWRGVLATQGALVLREGAFGLFALAPATAVAAAAGVPGG